MEMFQVTLVAFLLLWQIVAPQMIDKLDGKLYKHAFVNQVSFCSKLLNNKTVIGCDGSIGGDQGILLNKINQIKHLDLLQDVGYTFVPFVDAFYPNLKSLLKKLDNLTNVAGVIVVNRRLKAFPSDKTPRSDDVVCPNVRFNGHCYKWINTTNDNSLGSFFDHFSFQIFYLDDFYLIESIEKCIRKYNHNLIEYNKTTNSYRIRSRFFKPYCAAELYNPTYAPDKNVSADKCLRKRDRLLTFSKTYYCDKIQPTNFLVPLVPMVGYGGLLTYADRSILILAVRLDSLTLYTGKSPAADSVFTALISSVTVAHTLAKYKDYFQNSEKQVIFAFYGGESLDNIGSSFHAYELFENLNPESDYLGKKKINKILSSFNYSGIADLNLRQIGNVLELNQLADYSELLSESGTNSSSKLEYFLYSDPSSKDSLASRLFAIADTIPGLKLNKATVREFPPSTYHSFSKYNHRKGVDIDFNLITNHDGPFTNLFYHSVFDTPFPSLYSQLVNNFLHDFDHNNTWITLKLTDIVTLVSQTVAQFMREDFNLSAIEVDGGFIDELSTCIFIDRNCTLFNLIRSYQPGFYNQTNFHNTEAFTEDPFVEELVYDLMKYVTGQNVTCPSQDSRNETDRAFSYYVHPNQNESTKNETHHKICLRHQVFRVDAISPYFLGVNNSSIHFSQWVMSHKRIEGFAPELRIFLKPTFLYSFICFAMGAIAILFAVVIIFVCQDYFI